MSLSPADLVSHRTAGLIRGKARRFAELHQLREPDREDLIQDLFVHTLERADRYDPARGLVGAFLAQVINRKLAHIAEARHAQRRDIRRLVHVANLDRLRSSTWVVDDRLDIDDAINALQPSDRALAVSLQTYSIAEVARAGGVHRSRVRRQVARIRDHFRKRGLHTLCAGRRAA